MWRSADRLFWTALAGVPIGLLAAGFAGFLRIATARRRKTPYLLKRRVFGRAS
ncbi:MAG TPA: hypothetical protein VKW09_09195 [bacterium]|nr:hypothetical protein [bacterium]